MDIKNFINALSDKARSEGFTDFEIYYAHNETFSVNIYNSEVEKYQDNKMRGLSFRGLYNGVMSYAYTEKIDDSASDLLIQSAKQNSEIIDSPEKEFIYKGKDAYRNAKTYREELYAVQADQKVLKAILMEKSVLNADDRIKSVNSSSISSGSGETVIVNSNGLYLFQKSNYCIAYLSAIGIENGQTKTYDDFAVLNDFFGFDFVNFGFSIAEHLISKFNSVSLPTGDYPVIIQNKAFASLLSVFCPIFFAEKIQKGFSLLKNKKNEKIANKLVTIIEDPFLENGFNNSSFDDEGVATRKQNIIENGILKTYLYNLKSAYSDGAAPTGNGFKSSFKAPVTTGFTNLFLKPEKIQFEQMLGEMKNGLIITDLNGLHSGANAVSGDFSLSAEGFLVESGKITASVSQITVSGNFYTLIKNIVMIGSDLKFCLPGSFGCVGSPSVCIENLKIAGDSYSQTI